MITLSLLHPVKQIPVQVWTFENESVIRIGRSTDNQVVLYSAVVSRHHVELRRLGNSWEIVNLGTNGTYLDGKRITQVPITDGAIIRLARSGPNIRIRIGEVALKESPDVMSGDRTLGRPDYSIAPTEVTGQRNENMLERSSSSADAGKEADDHPPASPPTGLIPVPPHLQIPPTQIEIHSAVSGRGVNTASFASFISTAKAVCTHERSGNAKFCPHCGQPLEVLQTIGDYHILQVLGQGELGITYLAWRQGQNLVLKTLQPDWANHPIAQAGLECEAELMRQLNHAQIPSLLDFLTIDHQPYLAMEWIAGQSLAQRVSTHGPVPLWQAIDWVLEVCQILEYLHTFKPPVLHRNIQPGAIIRRYMPQNCGEIALVDFGAIKALALEQPQLIAMTGYAAPEQFSLDATPAVDLYALGMLLIYLLTGLCPVSFYGGDRPCEPFPLDALPELPTEAVPLVHSLIHPDPDQRYPSATALAIVLQSIKTQLTSHSHSQ